LGTEKTFVAFTGVFDENVNPDIAKACGTPAPKESIVKGTLTYN